MAKMNSCDRDFIAHKTLSIYWLFTKKKSLLTLDLEDNAVFRINPFPSDQTSYLYIQERSLHQIVYLFIFLLFFKILELTPKSDDPNSW